MKSVTVAVDEQLYQRARVRAEELETSVSDVVRQFLEEFAGQGADVERRKRLQAETLASIGSFRAGSRLSRDEAHDRDALR